MTREPYLLPAAAARLTQRVVTRLFDNGPLILPPVFRVILPLAVALVAGLGAGCQTYTSQSRSMTASWMAGNVEQSAKEFAEKAQRKSGGKDAILWHLEAGAAYRAAGKYLESNRHLDAAAVKIDEYERQARVKLGREAGAIMSNQQNLPYEGRSYDKIMLHTYRALNYLALGDVEKARPEIIRAYQRQQDAVDENKRRIEKAQVEEKESRDRDKVERAKANPQFTAALGEKVEKDLQGFKFYADYVNPFTVYLDGLYFLHAGSGGSDLERAIKSFHRVIEVAGDNQAVRASLVAATDALDGKAPVPVTYVIFETGRAASLEQVRIDVPILFANVSYVGAAFPRLESHPDFSRGLLVKAGDVQEPTAPVASMDSMIALDFKNDLPVIITKTIIATVAKAVAGYAINRAVEQQDDIAGILVRLATAAGQAAMNIADTRSWTTLPKEFQVACVPTPPDRKITITATGRGPVELTLGEGAVNVVYVRSVTAAGLLMINQFKLK